MITKSPRSALVCRAPSGTPGREQYLRMTDDGVVYWIDDQDAATPFASLREATRAALRLPGSLRAFGLPLAISPPPTFH